MKTQASAPQAAQKHFVAAQTQKSDLSLPTRTAVHRGVSLEYAEIAKEAWFTLGSVSAALGKPPAAWQNRLDEHEVREQLVRQPQGTQTTTLISEWGLYRLLVSHKTDHAPELRRWLTQDLLPKVRDSGKAMYIQEAKTNGVNLQFTDAQWEYLCAAPWMLDLLPLAAAGYSSNEIARLLGYNAAITARKRIEKLKRLGLLPEKIPTRLQRLTQALTQNHPPPNEPT